MHEIYVTRSGRNLGTPNAVRQIKKAVNTTLKAERVELPCEVDVLLTGDEGIRRLNREYRNVDKATDVLSFPQTELIPGEFSADDAVREPDDGIILLGDIAISLEACARQGEQLGHGAEREILYLAVHSVLHLLGYDHVDEDEKKKQMRAREREILKLLGENE